VGGDFYDLFEIEDERIGILIGDVSGKGLEAATLTSIVRNSVRMRAMDGLTPAETMTKTNDAFFALTSSETFVTAFFATLDTRDGTLTYVGAGHPPAMIKRTDGQVGLLGESESLLGAFLGTHFEDHLVLLSPGDVLVAYTDGVIEARDGGALYGQERLRDLLAGLADGTGPEGVAEAVYRDVVEYSGGVTHDDVAILALRRCG
jgi:serine phosphatase RsbU (regulator of sigma subunit)